MRKIFNLAIIALIAIGAASCSKDVDFNDGSNEDNTNKMVFNFAGINNGVTSYAITAEDFEKSVQDATVYLFEYKADQTGELLYVQNKEFTSNDYLIIVDDVSAFVDKQLVAYFTINNSAAFNAYVDLTAYTANSGKTEADLIAETTTTIAGKMARQDFLMTGAVNGSNNFPAWGEYPVTVKRRVARFDICNLSPAAIATIDKVTIKGAKDQSYVFGDATPSGSTVTGSAIATDIVYDLIASEYGADGATPLNWVEEWDTTDADPANHFIINKTTNSAFYLNPTDLVKATPENGTQLFIEATIGGVAKVFELNLSQDIEVLANYRYILTLTEDLRFRITVAEWDTAGDEIIGTKPLNTTLAPLAAPAGTAVKTYVGQTVALKNTGGSVSFSMTASSAKGTGFEWSDNTQTDISVSVDNKSVVTYAAPYFESEYTITVADLTAASSFNHTLTITDKATSKTYAIQFLYSVENPDALFEINETTFPDAAFREYVIGKMGEATLITQDLIDTFVGINFTDKTQYTSIKGVEYLSAITSLNLKNSTVKEGIDVSNLTKLQNLNIYGLPVESIDISNNTELTHFYGSESKLKSIDISNNKKLQYITINDTPSLTKFTIDTDDIYPDLERLEINSSISLEGNIDLSKLPALKYFAFCNALSLDYLDVTKHPNLKKLVINFTAVNYLDVTKCPELEHLSIQGTNITNIDLSQNPLLKNCYLASSKITSVDFSKNPLLNAVNIPYTIETIDFTPNPELTALSIGHWTLDAYGQHALVDVNCAITHIDISNCANFHTLLLRNCANLQEIKVKSGFTTEALTRYEIEGTTPTELPLVEVQ